jgi:hypothetical protein
VLQRLVHNTNITRGDVTQRQPPPHTLPSPTHNHNQREHLPSSTDLVPTPPASVRSTSSLSTGTNASPARALRPDPQHSRNDALSQQPRAAAGVGEGWLAEAVGSGVVDLLPEGAHVREGVGMDVGDTLSMAASPNQRKDPGLGALSQEEQASPEGLGEGLG